MTGAPFPADLPDLLRLACSQGKMRLNVWHGAEKGHQANLANSGDGWTVEHDRDPLEAITKVLRLRFGKMLERARVGDSTESSVHPAHLDNTRHQLTEAATGEEEASDGGVGGWEVEDGVWFALSRRGFDDATIAAIAGEVLDRIWGKDEQPNLHQVEMTMAGACSVETGYCMCGSPVEGHTLGDGHAPVDEGLYRAEQQRLADELDIDALIG